MIILVSDTSPKKKVSLLSRYNHLDHSSCLHVFISLLGKAAALERYNAAKGNQPERLVSGSDDFTMFFWEPEANKKPLARLTGHQKLVNHVSFSPDGRLIASAAFDNSVKLWDGRTGKFISSLRGHVGPVYQVCWSSDSRMLISSSKDTTLKIWDLKTKKIKLDLPGHLDEVSIRLLHLW